MVIFTPCASYLRAGCLPPLLNININILGKECAEYLAFHHAIYADPFRECFLNIAQCLNSYCFLIIVEVCYVHRGFDSDGIIRAGLNHVFFCNFLVSGNYLLQGILWTTAM